MYHLNLYIILHILIRMIFKWHKWFINTIKWLFINVCPSLTWFSILLYNIPHLVIFWAGYMMQYFFRKVHMTLGGIAFLWYNSLSEGCGKDGVMTVKSWGEIFKQTQVWLHKDSYMKIDFWLTYHYYLWKINLKIWNKIFLY